MIEAGPCCVTGHPHRTSATATTPCSSPSARSREKRLTKAELGHLKKAGAPPLRHLCEFRDEAGELKIGDR